MEALPIPFKPVAQPPCSNYVWTVPGIGTLLDLEVMWQFKISVSIKLNVVGPLAVLSMIAVGEERMSVLKIGISTNIQGPLLMEEFVEAVYDGKKPDTWQYDKINTT